jgi:hypothetical protein
MAIKRDTPLSISPDPGNMKAYGRPLTSPMATTEEQATLNRANAIKTKAIQERAAGINSQATRQQERAYSDSTINITKTIAERAKVARRKPSTMYKKK